MSNEIGYSIAYIDAEALKQSSNYFGILSVFKCTRGSACISKNEMKYSFSKGEYLIIIETISLAFTSWSDDFEATICDISAQLSSDIDPYLNSKMWNVFYYSTPSICKSVKMGLLDTIFAQLLIIHTSDTIEMRRQLAFNTMLNFSIALYNILLPHINSEDLNEDVMSVHASSIIDRFLFLCSEYHTTERNLEFYANKLHISQRHLYNLTQNTLKQTPKQTLDGYVIGTIKKLLLTSTLSIQQIADTLNFPDQSTLRQYFFRVMGVSPSTFRKEQK